MTVRVKVPEGMLNAIKQAARYVDTGNECLNSQQVSEVGIEVCRWLSENPIVPTVRQYIEMMKSDELPAIWEQACMIMRVWQRRMFLEQEDEVPEAIKDLLISSDPPFDSSFGFAPPVGIGAYNAAIINQHIINAYHRGLQSKDKEARVGAVEIENVRKEIQNRGLSK